MTYHAIRVVDGKYQVYRTTNGIDRTDVGPRWPTPKGAGNHCRLMDAMPITSPLRAPAVPSALPSEVTAGSPRGSRSRSPG